jgi:pyrrolidone-carboxylate peptidase
MKRILITAFEPFGFSGWLRQRNGSKDVLDLVKNQDNCDFLILPVSNNADRLLEETLATMRPSGILSMGEDMGMLPSSIHLEPFAYDTKATLNPLGCIGKKILSSTFAHAVLPDKSPCGIGTYHCNSIYKTALNWASQNGQMPVGFAHIAVLGDRQIQSQKIKNLLDQMRLIIDN